MPKLVDHEARRRDFIEAAYATIVEQGLANTTIRNVARKAGFTTGALVHYFKDKDELIREALNYFGSDLRDRMIEAHREHTGRAGLRATLIEGLPTNKRAAMSWRVWLALWYHSEGNEEMRREQRSRYREWIGRLKELLAESVESGDLPESLDITDEARSIVALMDGLGVQYLMSSGRMPKKRLTQMVDTYLTRLYGDPP
ncbi:MAG: TetR/AcrR family transcriptional regulator [Pseudomonadales bacterium]|nr:TetR/AcrR family transcriptional regulator [Pseudomonadales bacterium]